MSTIDDSDLLGNLEAARLEEAPAEDNPIHHVPEESLRNLNKLELALPEEQAQEAAHIAAEAMRIKKAGRICALEAEGLASLVPAIMGSEDAPVSYTSVPTSVGASVAVEIMEGAAASARASAVKRACAAAEQALGRADAALCQFEANWITALSHVSHAAEQVKAATGGVPEANPLMYLGNDPSMSVLSHSCTGDSPIADERVQELRASVERAFGFAKEPAAVLGANGYLTMGNKHYSLAALGRGLCQGSLSSPECTPLTLGQVLSTTVTTGQQVADEVQEAARALVQTLRTSAEAAQKSADDNSPISESADLVAKAALASALLDLLGKTMEALCAVAMATAKFYTACAHAPTAVVANERLAKPVKYENRRFFVKRQAH